VSDPIAQQHARASMPPPHGNVFSGQRASYIALAAISTLAIALLSSIWESDVSGSIALLGLLAVYLASNELLTLVGRLAFWLARGVAFCSCPCASLARARARASARAAERHAI
jgi:hypothetical protein